MNYTSVEQSKKLMGMGLKPESADLKFKYDFCEHQHSEKPTNIIIPTWDDPYNKDIPCWSVEKLLKLIPKNIKESYVSNCWEILPCYDGNFILNYITMKGDIIYSAKGDSLADVCYDIMIWLLEKGYIKYISTEVAGN